MVERLFRSNQQLQQKVPGDMRYVITNSLAVYAASADGEFCWKQGKVCRAESHTGVVWLRLVSGKFVEDEKIGMFLEGERLFFTTDEPTKWVLSDNLEVSTTIGRLYLEKA